MSARSRRAKPAKPRLTIADVAEQAGVKPDTITAYFQRGQMPAPESCPCCGTGTTWAADGEIAGWLAARPSQLQRTRVSV